MRLPCNLRALRGERSLRETAELAGVNAAELSRIENGLAVPRDKDLGGIALAYASPPEVWYPPLVLLALQLEEDPRIVVTVTVNGQPSA